MRTIKRCDGTAGLDGFFEVIDDGKVVFENVEFKCREWARENPSDRRITDLEADVLTLCGLPLPVETEAIYREIEELAACLRELAAAQGTTAVIRRGNRRLQQLTNECL